MSMTIRHLQKIRFRNFLIRTKEAGVSRILRIHRPVYGSGFSMVEVLVALFVLSIGLLGLAALQTTGIKFNQQSYQRTQATLQAYDIIDRMRTNRAGGAINANFDNVALSSMPGSANCNSTTDCTPDEMAEYDIRMWNTNNENLLTEGSGAVCRGTFDSDLTCTVGGVIYSVGIKWKESDIAMQMIFESQL
jgi:type IV pilus assembly protein PilV